MNYASYLFYLLVIGAILFIAIKIYIKFKLPRINCLVFTTGAVKSGKTLFSLNFAIKQLKKNRRKYKLKKFFFPKKFKNLEYPLLYSNIPLGVPYVELSEDLLLRKKRFAYGSVIFCDEASLVADSQLIKDMDVNNRLLLFNKLIGHELQGGSIFYDSQEKNDTHYSIKRCVSNYFYIHHTLNLFFFGIAYVREFVSCGEDVSNNVNEDLELSLRKVLISRKIAKMYDKYCFSILTDDLPVANDVIQPTKNKKIKKIISFRNWSDYVNQ